MANDPSPLVGQAIGDSLGMGFETQPANSPELLAWDGSYQPSAYHKLSAGQWTDDTMMARALAESLMSCNGYYPRDVADRYLAWYRSGDHRGMGRTTRTALTQLNEGVPWTRTGVIDALGNGSAMRAAPLGLYYQEDLATVREFARMDACVTHDSLEAEAGSTSVAVAVALLASGKADRSTLVEQLLPWVNEHELAVAISHLTEDLRGADIQKVLETTGTAAHVLQTVPAAIAAFIYTTSYQEAVEAAVRAGGDTDTTAAITGALAGTFYGFGGIPKKYLKDLEDFATLRKVEVRISKGPRSNILWAMDRSPIFPELG